MTTIPRPGDKAPISDYGLEKWETPFVLAPAAMASGTIVAPNIRPLRKIINKNLTALRDEKPERVTPKLIDIVNELQRSVDILWSRGLQPTEVASDGLAVHGSMCPLLNGQYLRITSAGVNKPIAMAHGLKRKPTGAIVVVEGSNVTRVVINGDNTTTPITPPATEDMVYFLPQFSTGTVICILF